MERENKPVSFNPNKPDEAAMLKHIRRKQFSKYVKKLITEDMARKKQKDPDLEPIQAKTESPDAMESPTFDEPAQSYGERLKEMKRERNQSGGPKLWMP